MHSADIGGGASTPASSATPPAPPVPVVTVVVVAVEVALEPPDPVGWAGVEEHARLKRSVERRLTRAGRRAIDSRMPARVSLVLTSLRRRLSRLPSGLVLRIRRASPPRRCGAKESAPRPSAREGGEPWLDTRTARPPRRLLARPARRLLAHGRRASASSRRPCVSRRAARRRRRNRRRRRRRLASLGRTGRRSRPRRRTRPRRGRSSICSIWRSPTPRRRGRSRRGRRRSTRWSRARSLGSMGLGRRRSPFDRGSCSRASSSGFARRGPRRSALRCPVRSDRRRSRSLRGGVAAALHELALFQGTPRRRSSGASRRGCAPTATAIAPLDWTPLRVAGHAAADRAGPRH